MTYLSIALFVALAEVLAYNGLSFRTPAFWLVLGIVVVIAVLNFAIGLAALSRDGGKT